MANNKTFMRITNKDLWKKVCEMHNDIKDMNGKIRLNKWAAGTAITLAILAISIKFIF